MLTRNDIRLNEYILRFGLMFHVLPLRLDPATGQMYMKENELLGRSIFLIYRIILGCWSIFAVYRSVDFIILSGSWDPILSPVTLIAVIVGGMAVINMHVLLANIQKGVKLYNGVFNLNEDKG